MVQPGSAVTPAERAGWAVVDGDSGAGAAAPDALLAAAIEEERAARGGRFQVPAVREVSQVELTAGRDRLASTQNFMGMAFGPEHEARLRAEAGAKPSDIQRRKHQIGSLLYDAKLQELKLMEGRLQGMKSKRETQAKYGW